tara:strand:- start:335 stop:745 length:411 start_codon:yes stop_codon:yes gene_type:complete
MKDKIYTQEMHDSETPPPVGCLFKVRKDVYIGSRLFDFAGLEVEVVRVNHFKGQCIVTFYNPDMGFGCGSYNGGWVKPITPELELMDGRAYQFTNIEGDAIHGIYSDDDHSFRGTCIEWCASTSTNIKALTVDSNK